MRRRAQGTDGTDGAGGGEGGKEGGKEDVTGDGVGGGTGDGMGSCTEGGEGAKVGASVTTCADRPTCEKMVSPTHMRSSMTRAALVLSDFSSWWRDWRPRSTSVGLPGTTIAVDMFEVSLRLRSHRQRPSIFPCWSAVCIFRSSLSRRMRLSCARRSRATCCSEASALPWASKHPTAAAWPQSDAMSRAKKRWRTGGVRGTGKQGSSNKTAAA